MAGACGEAVSRARMSGAAASLLQAGQAKMCCPAALRPAACTTAGWQILTTRSYHPPWSLWRSCRPPCHFARGRSGPLISTYLRRMRCTGGWRKTRIRRRTTNPWDKFRKAPLRTLDGTLQPGGDQEWAGCAHSEVRKVYPAACLGLAVRTTMPAG